MNSVNLVGRIVRDPELRIIASSGKSMCRFVVAINRYGKKDEADFISCVAFGKIAENVAKYFVKGKEIAVVGTLRTGSFEDKEGNKRYTTDVFVDNFFFVGSK